VKIISLIHIHVKLQPLHKCSQYKFLDADKSWNSSVLGIANLHSRSIFIFNLDSSSSSSDSFHSKTDGDMSLS
jgi:hypothetical protein